MKIAILGTRGIPNAYGGFEQCAEKIALNFVKNGHEVNVYNTLEHPYKMDEWNGVRISRVASLSKFNILPNTFQYDFATLKDAIYNDFDIILQLGYAPSALFYFLNNNKKSRIVTNMAGMEWKRSKWNFFAKKIIRFCKKLAVKNSDCLISDNPGIKNYYKKTYSKESIYIPYGAEIFRNSDISILNKFNVVSYEYFVLLARFQPDNNLEIILDGYEASKSKLPFIVIGGHQNKYGNYLKRKYINNEKIRFVGGIYDYNIVSNLRCFCRLYFHGHSCGGTNPSLLEAMASNSYIVSHDNIFNRSILEENAFYFKNSKDVTKIITNYSCMNREKFCLNNKKKIVSEFNWETVSESYLKTFAQLLAS